MAETFTKSGDRAEQRVELAGKVLDKLDIARRLIEMHPIDSKLALARQLLECAADQIAELAGDDDRERRAIERAAAPRPERRRPGMFQRLDQLVFAVFVGAAVAFVLGWIVYSFGFHVGWWL